MSSRINRVWRETVAYLRVYWNRSKRAKVATLLTSLMLFANIAFFVGLEFQNWPVAQAANGLTFAKTQDGNPVIGGQTTYTLTVTNNTIAPSAYNLTLTDVLPPGMTYASSTGTNLGAPTIATAGVGCAAQQTLTWQNIKDLALNETYTITVTAQLNPCIVVGTVLTNNANATVSTDPRDTTGPISAGGGTSTGTALPFKLTKKTIQSTGVGQDTGDCSGPGAGRQFYFQLTVQNNFVGPSQNAVVTDTLPDGVAYCGTMNTSSGGANIAPTVTGPDPVTGQTTLTWNLGTLATSQQILLQPDVVILYQYRGTANGGPNAFVEDDKVFTNTSSLNGDYLGINYTSGPATSTVKASYATIAKASSVNTVATGDIVTYTLTPSTSTNYDASNMYIIDTVPNGQDVVPGTFTPAAVQPSDQAELNSVFVPCGANANLVPAIDHGGVIAGGHTAGSGIYLCTDGTTQVSWGVLNNSANTPMTAGTQFNLTFQAQVRVNYRNGTLPPVLATDDFTNYVGMRFDADSIPGLPLPNQGNGGLTNRNRWENASAGQATTAVKLNKNILGVSLGNGAPPPAGEGRVTDPGGIVAGGPGSRTVNRNAVAAVGDIVTFQLDFIGSGTADMKNIVLRDFLPLNYTYVGGSATYFNTGPNAYAATVNGAAINPGTGTGPAPVYTAGTGPGGGGGTLEFNLTGVAGDNITHKNSTFRVQFKAQVQDGTAGLANDNLGKVSGINTAGASYSDRDVVTTSTLAPNLTLTKTNNAPGAGVFGSQTFNYTLVIKNTGTSTAYRVTSLTDAIPADIGYRSVVSVTPSFPSTTVATPTYPPGPAGFGGTLSFAFAPDYEIPPNGTVTIIYQAQVQGAPVVGTVETNTATTSSYNSQPPGVTVSKTYPPVTGTSTVKIGGQTLTKTGVIRQPQVNGAGGRVTIGDVVDYTLTFSLPGNATFPNGEIRDCMPRYFRYLAGSYSSSTSAPLPGPGALPANDVAAGFTVVAGNGPCAANRDYVIVNFGTQNNAGAAITITIKLSATITGVDRGGATNFPAPGPTNSQTNQAYVFADVGGTQTQQGNAVTSPAIPIYAPNLTLNKTLIRPSSPTPGGVNVDFLITLSNTGGSTAYEISPLVDTLDPGFTYVGAYISDATCSLATIIPSNLVPGVTTAGQVVTIPVTPGNTPPASLAQTANYYVCLRATLTGAVSPSTTYNNGVTLGTGAGNNYYSAPATYPGRRAYTNNQNPVASISTSNAAVSKTETSGNPSANGVAVPGEVIRFQLKFTIPAGTTLYNPVVTDNFNFAAAGSRLGAPIDTTPGGGTLTCTGGATQTYTFAVVAGKATYTFGGNLAAAGVVDNDCTLEIQAQVLNIAVNTVGQPPISNDFTLTFNRSTGTAVPPLTSNGVQVAIHEPNVTIVKALVSGYDPLTGQATFSLTLTNAGTATISPAYNLSVTDPFPAGLVYVSNTAPTVGAGVVNPVASNTANSVSLTVDSLAPGASTSLNVTVKGDGTLGAGTTLTNIANLTYYDLPATINGNNNQADPTSRRFYTGSSSLPISLPGPTFSKTPATQTITVLGTVNFALNVTVPAGVQMFNVVVGDTLPAGLVLQPNGFTYGGVAPATCPAPGLTPVPGNGPANLGNLSNTTAGNCTYTINVAAVSDGTAPPVGVGTTPPLNNTGTFSYSSTNGGPPVITTRTADVIIRAPILTLVKTNVPTGPVAIGATIAYTLAYANTGPVAATNVIVTDAIPAGTTVVPGSISAPGGIVGPNVVWNLGTLNPSNGTLTFSVQVNALPANGSITNGATLTSNERPPVTTSVTNSTANLLVSKSANPASGTTVNPGQNITYSILLTNPSPPATANATGISVNDAVPANTTYVAGSAASTCGATINAAASPINWSNIDLAPNATCTLTFQVKVNLPLPNGTQIPNQATYTSDQLTTPNTTNTTVHTVTSAPNLALVKTNNPTGALGVNGQVVYSLQLTNTGNENAGNVVISDTLPAGTTFVSASAGGSYNLATNAVSWNIGTLAGPAGTVAVNFTVQVSAGSNGQVPAGLVLNNRGNYSFDNGSGGNKGTGQSNQVTNNTLSHVLTKTNNPPETVKVAPGSQITYSLTYTNTGSADFTAVTITDNLPAYTSFVSAANGGTFAAGVVTWNLGVVKAGEVRTVSYIVQVNTPLANGTEIDNQAVATGTGVASGTVPDAPSNLVRNFVTSSPVFVIAKAVSPTTPVASGDLLTYSLVITNTGNANATNVVAEDTIPAGTTYLPGTATGGTTASLNGNVLRWTLAGLNAGSSATLQFQVQVNNPLPRNTAGIPVDITNQASVIGSTETGTLTKPPVSNIVTNPTIGLLISKAVPQPGNGEVAYYGGTISYSLVFTNVGSLTLTSVQVIDDLPVGTSFRSAGQGGVFSPGGLFGRGRIIWNVGTLTAGQPGTVTFIVTVDNPTSPPNLLIFNTAQIVASQLTGNVVSNQVSNPTGPRPPNAPTPTPTPSVSPSVSPTATLTVSPTITATPELTPTPTGSAGPPPTQTPGGTIIAKQDPFILKVSDAKVAVAGQTVKFTITVTNPGSVAANNIVVNENLPAPFKVQGTTTSQGTVTASGQSLTINIGTIPPGGSVTIVVTTLVAEGFNGQVTNTASFTGVTEDGRKMGGSSAVQVDLPGLPNTGQPPEPASHDLWGWLVYALLVAGGVYLIRRRIRTGNR